MFCSTIIPTVGRDSLDRTVQSVLGQRFEADSYEVIVVNDSGRPLPPAAWQQDGRVQQLHTQKRERSVARNTGAAAARGRYLHFLDDDDWLVPGALQHFWERSQTTPAAWLYGRSQLVNENGQPIIQLQHGLTGNAFLPVIAGEWIPLQSSLIKASVFLSVGGFHPLISGPEDIDLLRRICLSEELAEVDAVVACLVRGQEGRTTTDYDRHPEQSRWARERILDMPGAFSRMRPGTYSGDWHGRMVRVYLTSVLWNIRHHRLFTIADRGCLAAVSLLLAGKYLFTPLFWRSVTRAYESDTFQRGFAAAKTTGSR